MRRPIIPMALALLLVQCTLWPIAEIIHMAPPATTRVSLVESDTLRSVQQAESWCVTVTGYSSDVGQTDSSPCITASNTLVKPGIIALSRDLLQRYTLGAPFAWGDSVLVAGKTYVVEDTMNKRWSKRADIWFPSTIEARRFGKQELELRRKA